VRSKDQTPTTRLAGENFFYITLAMNLLCFEFLPAGLLVLLDRT
jgi:Na+/H+ antiporter NhaB